MAEIVPFEDFDSGGYQLPFAVIGDTQKTSKFEALIGRERNYKKTKKLISALAEEEVDLIVHLGDAIFSGKYREWHKFNQLMSPIRENETPLLLIMGNHEYSGNKSKSFKIIKKQFPQMVLSKWYAREYSNIALIFLDTNKKKLGEENWSRQKKWYLEKIKLYKDDPNILGLMLFTHHPPFTNSKLTNDEKYVEKAFLTPFFTEKKALAVISGHAHGFEHFIKRDKHFIISAGGGGPRVKYHTGKKMRHIDRSKLSIPRPFNYLLIEPKTKSINVKVRGFYNIEDNIKTLESFDISFNL